VTIYFDVAYQSHLNRLKYFEPYPDDARAYHGIYNMGRNFSIKVHVQANMFGKGLFNFYPVPVSLQKTTAITIQLAFVFIRFESVLKPMAFYTFSFHSLLFITG
jgi:hypothetical protein